MADSKSIASLWGYLLPGEPAYLSRFTKEVGDRCNGKPRIVNIGAGAGTSGLVFRETCKDADLYTVDYCESGPLGSLEGERNAFKDSGLAIPTQILGKSADIGRTWDKGEIDLLFIDDGHLRPEVIADIEAWWPHVKMGGRVIFHDYTGVAWPDVKEVVDEYMGGQDIIGQFVTLYVVEKVKEL